VPLLPLLLGDYMIIRAKYTAKIDNPEYRYGDLNRLSYKIVNGTGVILSYDSELKYALVADEESGAVYKTNISHLEVLVQDSLSLRVNHK
jgi:hypothetical protein